MKQEGKLETSRAIRWGLGIGVMMIVGALAWQELPARRGTSVQSASLPKKWEFTSIGPVTGALALGDDGTVYAASEDGFVYALDAAGSLQWKFEAGPMQAAPAIGADGTIYVTNEDQRIFAINRTGTQQWAVGGGPYADKQMGKIAAAIDQNYLYTPWRGPLRALRLTGGAIDWDAGVGFERGGSVSILPNGVIVYSGVGRIDAVYSGGKTVWQYPAMDPPLSVDMILKTGGHIPPGNFWLDSGIAVGADGTLYTCAVDSRLVGIASSGSYKWEFKTKTHSNNRATPVIATDGMIYFGSGDGTLYALNSDGTQKWAVDTGGTIVATPMLAEDGTVYVLNGASLLAVSPEGKVIAKTAVSGGVESSPTLAPDGTVYVASRGGKILAFVGTHGALMNSPWPKFQGNLANSGRAHPL
jgi:outer membrane protein assembly factor BamB